MGYLHIDNLYKSQFILSFRQCYALEKIHGTSAHMKWKDGALTFFSGGEKYDRFVALFDAEVLTAKFAERFPKEQEATVYGEAYGGKQQGMSATYGPALRFIAFDVLVDDNWLAVPAAEELVRHLGLEFVDYALIPTDVNVINAERDKPSTQAKRNGITEDKLREGVVLRPPFEVKLNSGARLIAKHKGEAFSERGRPKLEDLDPTKREVLVQAGAIATEWVTTMRLDHVIDKILASRAEKEIQMSDTPAVIAAMVEDVQREAVGEIVQSAEARKAIGRRTVELLKHKVGGLVLGGL